MHEIEIRCDELHKYRHIRGKNLQIVTQKAAAQIKAWEEMLKKNVRLRKQGQIERLLLIIKKLRKR